MNIKCPVCNSNLIYRRVDDNDSAIIIEAEDKIKVIGVRSNGYTQVYCSQDKEHNKEIPEEVIEEIIEIASGFGY